MPTMYIIAGPNGAGKTTASKTVLPEMLNCYQFVNADEIAKGLSPFAPESVSFQAGRIMLQRIEDLLKERNDFGIETTLATRSYTNLIKRARENGFIIVLLFFWLPSADLAKKRVAGRVSEGGHNIPVEVIERRYRAGLMNFPAFIKITDRWYMYNNESLPAELIAKGGIEIETEIANLAIWEQLKK
jgi:predicted ABC-type ATPase